jgi:predicted nucleic-acid-binding Zn-ribbon protein
MQIVCYNCKYIWELPDKEIHEAKRKSGHSSESLTITCPKCGARNVVSESELEITDRTQSQVPVTGARAGEAMEEKEYSVMEGTATAAPTNPVEASRPGLQKRGIVRVRGLEAHMDYNTWSEVMGRFNKGETVPVLDAWTDGESTWLQLGPERWVNLDQNGEAAIELLDD